MWGRGWVEGGECQKDKLYPLVNYAQTNLWRNTTGKWDTDHTHFFASVSQEP